SVSRLLLAPRLPRSVGLGPVAFSPQRGFGHRPIHRLPGPFQTFQLVVFLQAERPELVKDARRYPLLEATMGRAARTDAGGVQSVPLAARTQHEENGVEGTAVVHPGVMTTQRMRLAGRQQRLDLGPELIRDAPGAACLLCFHRVPSCGNSCRLLEGFDGPRG